MKGVRQRWVLPWMLITVLAAPWAKAQQPLEEALKEDVVLRALIDELDRSTRDLLLPGLPKPYFIEFALQDQARSFVDARLGSVTRQASRRTRGIRTDVRVGDYSLDNTNYSGMSFGGGDGGGGADMPIEDDYQAIRQAIWWVADRDYKQVVEDLEAKKAFMASKVMEEKPADLSRQEPVVHIQSRVESVSELDSAAALAKKLSCLFLKYPDVQESSVQLDLIQENRYLVNSEGTRMRVPFQTTTLSISASVQATDGMRLAASSNLVASDLKGLPGEVELADQCREMADELVKLKTAPVLDAYSGPVLMDGEAAAATFATRFSGNFSGGQRPVGSRSSADDFAKKLNRRVLPTFLNVVDDPTMNDFEGRPLLSHYLYDDQGVPGQRVSLVEAGRLKSLLMSRNPSKEFAVSTGHGRGNLITRAVVSTLMVTAAPANTAEQMKQELIESCLDEGLDFGLRICSFGAIGGSFGTRGGGGPAPLVMYKVFPDGREEMARGAEISRVDLRAFKRILAAGDKPFAFESGGQTPRTVMCPALLFEELDLAKIDRDFDKPPIMSNPVADLQDLSRVCDYGLDQLNDAAGK